ncbi:aspartate/glutamate racemase family protein [Arcobacter sp.]|uniref:aspartate/glutamate racemase family protein n=1 Tax=Arcobacter sp. TaxID=1872629 RepID=UPI003D0D9F34
MKIGIIGGVGPYAGLDLNRKIYDNQKTYGKDQDYIDVILISNASDITDRTGYLKNEVKVNPAEGLFRAALKLEQMGANVIAISCNTAHSPKIFDKVCELMNIAKCEAKLLNIVEETHKFLEKNYSNLDNIGFLGTLGTYETKLYENYFVKMNKFKFINPSERGKNNCHDAIYNTEYGVKAQSNPITKKAKKIFENEIVKLKNMGVEAVIMGCTEIPLAFNDKTVYKDVLLIDPSTILARALISNINENLLKDYTYSK